MTEVSYEYAHTSWMVPNLAHAEPRFQLCSLSAVTWGLTTLNPSKRIYATYNNTGYIKPYIVYTRLESWQLLGKAVHLKSCYLKSIVSYPTEQNPWIFWHHFQPTHLLTNHILTTSVYTYHLFTLDVVFLYKSIPHEQRLLALKFFFNRRCWPAIPTITIVCLTWPVFKLNSSGVNTSKFNGAISISSEIQVPNCKVTNQDTNIAAIHQVNQVFISISMK